MQKIILDLIKINGFITLDDLIFQSMYHPIYGYYLRSNPIQKDFTTSPEITNAFGIIIANYIIKKILLFPTIDDIEIINLIEFGGGSGKLAFDIISFLINLKKLNNGEINWIIEKINFNSIELSKKLEEIQKNTLKNIPIKKYFFQDISQFFENQNYSYENKKIINIFYSNEFFDAIPIKQFVVHNNEFFEIIVTEKNNKLIFSKIKINPNLFPEKYFKITENAIMEFPAVGLNIVNKIINIMKNHPSLFITFDYGFCENKYQSTLQGIHCGQKTTEILENIGDTDITHLVNFPLIAEEFSLCGFNPKIETQRNFLIGHGIESLVTETNRAGINRLIDGDLMGETFKVLTADSLIHF